jgi:hypothetical protein
MVHCPKVEVEDSFSARSGISISKTLKRKKWRQATCRRLKTNFLKNGRQGITPFNDVDGPLASRSNQIQLQPKKSKWRSGPLN